MLVENVMENQFFILIGSSCGLECFNFFDDFLTFAVGLSAFSQDKSAQTRV